MLDRLFDIGRLKIAGLTNNKSLQDSYRNNILNFAQHVDHKILSRIDREGIGILMLDSALEPAMVRYLCTCRVIQSVLLNT